MKSTIKGIVQLGEDRNRRVKADTHSQRVQDQKAHDAKVSTLEERIAAAKKKMQTVTEEHKEKEQALRKVSAVVT